MAAAGRVRGNAAGAPAAGTSKRLSGIGRDRLISIASPIGLLVAWEVAARLHAIDTRFFPAPSGVARRVGALIGFALTLALNELERWLIPWKPER